MKKIYYFSIVLLISFGTSDLAWGQSNVFPPRGNVGINTATPNTMLHINGMGVENDGSTAVVRIVSGNGAQNLLLDGNEIDATADGLFLNNNSAENVILAKGGGNVGIGKTNPGAKLDVEGTTKTKVLEITGGADLAEQFKIVGKESIKPGLLVSIDPMQEGTLRLSTKPYDRMVAGIVSGANGLSAGVTLKSTGVWIDRSVPVTLTGRAYCWANTSNGPIKPGDLLTTSATPGHAMRVTDWRLAQGAIIGKAMTALSSDRGFVLVLVSLQ